MADMPWEGPIGRLDRPTSDGRVVESAGFTVRTLPLPVDWQEYTDEGHDQAVTVARMDRVEVMDDGTVWGYGVWLDPAVIPQVDRAKYLADQPVTYPSMEPAGCAMEYRWTGGGDPYYDDGGLQESMPGEEVCVFTSFELAKVSLVSVQAFPDLYIRTPGAAPASLVAAVRSEGWADMPVADAGTEWDGNAAAQRVAEWAGIDDPDAGQEEWDKYARAFLWQDPDADPMTRGAYKLGVADVIDGELTIVPRAVYAVAGVLSGARGGADIPAGDQERLQGVVRGLYEHLAGALDDDTIEAPFALTACAAVNRPPREFFDYPGFTSYQPFTVSEPNADGWRRIFGHIGQHGVPHRGVGVPIPRSMSNYREFLLGLTMTADGTGVPTGKITIGGGHADDRFGAQPSRDHYDNVSTTIANVTAGDDQFGVWISGAIRHDATIAEVDELLQSPPSGDWRTDVLGNLEMIGVHSVNNPGYPVYRVGVDDKGGYTLVASSAIPRQGAAPRAEMPAPVPVVRPQFAAAPEGDNLRAQFAAAGVPWPTISVNVAGVDLPPFEVAEGCVRGMLAAAVPVDPANDPVAVYASTVITQAQARARLRLAGME